MVQPETSDPVFEVERVLESVPARVFAFGAPGHAEKAIAVAYSGGLDSTVLLHLAHAYAAPKGMRLFAFHIHHGLNARADDWLSHCREICGQLGITFEARRVTLNLQEGEGTEAAARRERYAALADMCARHGVGLLLTAHHEDDQAETVLLQLMRGAGVAGLSGMEVLGAIPGTEGETLPKLLRPLLAVSRQALESRAKKNHLAWVEDDSNQDDRYARNAIRLKVAPVLSLFFPGFERRVTRSAQHMQSAGRLLRALAEMDRETCRDGDTLDIARMVALGEDRFDNLFRFWLGEHGLRMPSAAWLKEAKTQLLDAREDAQVKLELEGAVIRRYRKKLLFLGKKEVDNPVLPEPLPPFRWQGELRIPVVAWGGEFRFDAAEEGVDAAWLRETSLQIKPYSGKAMLRAEKGRPTRNLKVHYQEKQVGAWERQRLPLLYAGEKLLFAAGIGMAASETGKGRNRVRISWVAEK